MGGFTVCSMNTHASHTSVTIASCVLGIRPGGETKVACHPDLLSGLSLRAFTTDWYTTPLVRVSRGRSLVEEGQDHYNSELARPCVMA